MADFELVRVAIADEGSFGVLKQDNLPFALTLERTFGEDVVIPPGEWPCKQVMFNKGGYRTFEVFIPGHEHVKFHVGNTEMDSDGCILVGLEWKTKGKPGVALSQLGFLEFMRRAGGRKHFMLEVKDGS